MRKKLVAGNWKMNKTAPEAQQTVDEINRGLSGRTVSCDAWIAPPALYVQQLKSQFPDMNIGLQDLSIHDSGAFTGELSAPMAVSVGAGFSLVGHSERRQYHGEDDVLIHQKILACLRHQITAVYCCGENLDERKAGREKEVVSLQIREALRSLSADAMAGVIVAYEPVWAIGTGETATAEQAGEMHAFIREELADMFGKETAEQVRILYGGSMKPGNAAELFAVPDIDGGLIGGASLKPADFLAIIEAAGE